MLFSSMIFLWLFLPFVLIVNMILPPRARNVFLLAANFVFYAWGEQEYIWVLLASLAVNFYGARFLEYFSVGRSVLYKMRRLAFVLLLAVNLGFLGYFKYFDFFSGLIGKIAGHPVVGQRNLTLPIGISFFTFQMISYLADVYRGDIQAERSLSHLMLYISFFPKMIQGPIVRYGGFEPFIRNRRVTAESFAYGARRFIYGLSKKLILADQLGSVVDKVLSSPMDQISGGLGWYIGILYTLQIYFDFSGYSDMAVGVGKMLGFGLMENFDYPYLSKSVGEFWRRWHISLSAWFKDYVYIPLGGSRKGVTRTCLNLMLVFLCTGFWHGAGLSFLVWGLYYGVLQVTERLFLNKYLGRLPAVAGHVYMCLVTVVGWTMFRSDSLTRGLVLLGRMFLMRPGIYNISMFVTHKTTSYLVISILLCGPLQALLPRLRKHMVDEDSVFLLESIGLAVLFAYCIVTAVGSTYHPFIYFRF